MYRDKISITKLVMLYKWQIIRNCVCSRYLALICTHAGRSYYLPLTYMVSKSCRSSSASGNLKDLQTVLHVSWGSTPHLHKQKDGEKCTLDTFQIYFKWMLLWIGKHLRNIGVEVKKTRFHEIWLLQSWETWNAHGGLPPRHWDP